MIQHIRAGILIGLVACGTAHATIVVTGDSTSSTKTFTFGIGPTSNIYSSQGGLTALLVGAAQEVADNTYALSLYVPALANQFIPLAIKKITLNGTHKQDNPLYGKQIKYVHADNSQEKTFLYSVVNSATAQTERFSVINEFEATADNLTNPAISLYRSPVPYDAGSTRAGNIVALTSAYVDRIGSTAFGAVTQNGSAFGTGNSGITAARLLKIENTATKTFRRTFQMWNFNTGKAGNQACLFNTSIAALNLETDTPTLETTLDPVVDLHWDHSLERLYVAVRITAASGTTNGACAVAVGRISGGKLTFEPFVSKEAVLSSNYNIIVGARNGTSAAIYKVRTMYTSTGLNYLIVNGGNPASPAGGVHRTPYAGGTNTLYALPIVKYYHPTTAQARTHGTAADVTKEPTTTYNSSTNTYQRRAFTSAATTAAQLHTSTDTAAMVGAGPVPFLSTIPGGTQQLADLTIMGDTVYATTPRTYDSSGNVVQQPGVYASHAIFDHVGRIAAWTPWQRVTGTTDSVYHAYPDAPSGSFVFATGDSGTTIDTVKKTEWGKGTKDGLLGGTSADGSVGLTSVMNTMFPVDNGGIQHLSQYNEYESGLDGKTVMLAASNNRFTFVITGDDRAASETIEPYVGDFATTAVYNTDGTFPSGSGVVFGISGGALAQIGPASAATIFSSGTGNEKRSWIAVGGTNGLTILSDAQGNGYAPSQIPTNFTFKTVGAYSFVRKLVSDGQYLYVLTNNVLDRITIDPASFVGGRAQRTHVATPDILNSGPYSSFYDVLIGNNFALLATNAGLWRIANGYSIKHGAPQWTSICLRESLLPVYSLAMASSAYTVTDGFASGSQVYAFSAYQGYDDARIYRLYVHEGSAVDDNTIRPISDLFVQGIPSYFASFGQMQAYYTDLGSMRLVSRPQNRDRIMALETLPASLRVGTFNFPTTRRHLTPVKGPNCGLIGPAMLATASGAWLSFGDFGLEINE